MKRELNKKIISVCEEAGTAAAREKCGELMDNADREYDELVSSGMTELDAYREMMKRIDEIQRIVDSLPKDEPSPGEKKDRENGRKTLKMLLDKTSTVMWLVTVLLFFVISLASGKWYVTWVIFLVAAMGQILLDTLKDLNGSKKSRKKLIKSCASSCLWLTAVSLYFIISFASGLWGLTWLIFVAAAIAQSLIG